MVVIFNFFYVQIDNIEKVAETPEVQNEDVERMFHEAHGRSVTFAQPIEVLEQTEVNVIALKSILMQ